MNIRFGSVNRTGFKRNFLWIVILSVILQAFFLTLDQARAEPESLLAVQLIGTYSPPELWPDIKVSFFWYQVMNESDPDYDYYIIYGEVNRLKGEGWWLIFWTEILEWESNAYPIVLSYKPPSNGVWGPSSFTIGTGSASITFSTNSPGDWHIEEYPTNGNVWRGIAHKRWNDFWWTKHWHKMSFGLTVKLKQGYPHHLYLRCRMETKIRIEAPFLKWAGKMYSRDTGCYGVHLPDLNGKD